MKMMRCLGSAARMIASATARTHQWANQMPYQSMAWPPKRSVGRWAEGLSAGIEPEIIAEAALQTAFAELTRSGGEKAALALLERMRERVIAGEFARSLLRH